METKRTEAKVTRSVSCTKNGIIKAISDYFFGATITLTELKPGLYAISNLNGPVQNFYVQISHNRYRFIEQMGFQWV